MGNEIYSVWLQLACGTASPMVSRLFDVYGSAKAIYEENEYRAFARHKALIPRLQRKNTSAAEQIVKTCFARGIRIITASDDTYPISLLGLEKIPPVLYCAGDIKLLCTRSAAIIGSRSASPEGLRAASRLAGAFARHGITVISGMARGIDGAAHRGALSEGGKTVAVLGTPADKPYPSENTALYNEIVRCGCVVSELYPGEEVGKWNFAERNRIISGLSSMVVVGEAGEGSGALITARHAEKQGKRVCCLPGSPTASYAGTAGLVSAGCTCFASAADAIREFGALYGDMVRDEPAVELPFEASKAPEETKDASPPESATGLEDRIIKLLDGYESLTVNKITGLLNENTARVMAAVTILELAGRIESLPGDRYKNRK